MRTLGLVTFLSDFGWSGGYVAACEATMLRISRDLRVAHISHEVPVGDVAAGALVLARVASLYPEAVHLGVVDPGVGTSRHPLALATARGDFLVGPDNGLLLPAAEELGGVSGAWALDPGTVRSRAGLPADGVSCTFHGRDVFSPAAALLATGLDPAALGKRLERGLLCRLPAIPAAVTRDRIEAPVVEIDRFGNAGLGVALADLPGGPGIGAVVSVDVVGGDVRTWTAKVVCTYGDLAAGEIGLMRDSWGNAALTVNRASAAELLGLKPGVLVRVTSAKEDSNGR